MENEIKKLKEKLKEKEKYNKILQYQLKKKEEEIQSKNNRIDNLMSEIAYEQSARTEAEYYVCDDLQDLLEEYQNKTNKDTITIKEINEMLEKIKEQY